MRWVGQGFDGDPALLVECELCGNGRGRVARARSPVPSAGRRGSAITAPVLPRGDRTPLGCPEAGVWSGVAVMVVRAGALSRDIIYYVRT
jgi:hypothetical protein